MTEVRGGEGVLLRYHGISLAFVRAATDLYRG